MFDLSTAAIVTPVAIVALPLLVWAKRRWFATINARATSLAEALQAKLNGAVEELEAERRKRVEVNNTIAIITGERDKWRQMYDTQGREYGNAQSLMLTQIDQLARLAARYGAPVKLPKIVEALRTDAELPPIETPFLHAWRLLANVGPDAQRLTVVERIKAVEQIVARGCNWRAFHPSGAQGWASEQLLAADNQVTHNLTEATGTEKAPSETPASGA